MGGKLRILAQQMRPSGRRGTGSAGPLGAAPWGAAPQALRGRAYPPLRIMSKKSWLFLLAFIFSRMNSIASISSMG